MTVFRNVAGAIAALTMTAGVAAANWSVAPESGWIVEAPTAFGPADGGGAAVALTCFDDKAPLAIVTTGQQEGPEISDVIMTIDGREFRLAARREDDKWIGEPTPLLIAALARGLVLEVSAPAAEPARISLRGSARALGEVMTPCTAVFG